MQASISSRSSDEIRLRLAQVLARLGERSSLSLGLPSATEAAFLASLPNGLRDAGALLQLFLAESHRAPFPGLRDMTRTVATLPEAAVCGAVASADAILQGNIPLLGGQLINYGDPIDWHREPRSNVVVPLKHWSRIDYLNPAVAGDKKIIWEINRQQYLLTLGRAYAATRDDRYAKAFVDHVEAWIAANPPKTGINWASSLEVAFRAITWVWALFMFRGSDRVTPGFFLQFIKTLDSMGRHVERYLSTYFSPNTHLTGEALGLHTLASALPFLPSSARWRKTARSILLSQLRTQVRPDGTYFENATYYHRYTLDIYVHFAVLAEADGHPLHADALARIGSLADALAALIRPDGTHGFLGDDDGGRLLPLDATAINDFKPALSNAAVLLRRASHKAAAGSLAEETIWLFGPHARETFEGLPSDAPPGSSQALKDGGYYIMRDGSGPLSNQLTIDCGPHGAMNCGHAHADALAFELVSRGRSTLVDAGTYTYTGDAQLRRAFRSTAFHNALTVDRQSSSEPAGPFSWHSKATCRTLHWSTNDQFDFFEGDHDGFGRLAQPVAYRRSVLFIKRNYWIVRDRVESNEPHIYTQHFHVASGLRPQLVNACVPAGLVRCGGDNDRGPGLDIVSLADGGCWAFDEGWISPRYGDRHPVRSPSFTLTAPSADIMTFLLPHDGDGSRLVPIESKSENGRAFRIAATGERKTYEILAVRTGKELIVDDMHSDAEWFWARVQNGRIEKIILHNATRLEKNGKPQLSSPSRFHASLWRDGDGFCIDCNDCLDASGLNAPVRFLQNSSPTTNISDRAAMAKTTVL